MQIHFLHHSAVCVKMGSALLVFDYYMDDARAQELVSGACDSGKPVYVFVSHAHHDHYSPQIFDWNGPGVTYILDDTVPMEDAPEGAVFLHRGKEYDDGCVFVREFGSTDMGGSFHVVCEGTSFFHAGDLNDWHWKDDGNERYSRVMGKLYERELRHLKKRITHIDYAFFPVDKRMGTDYDTGADQFIKVLNPGHFIPIHFVDFKDTLAYSEKMKNKGTQVLPVHENGERLV